MYRLIVNLATYCLLGATLAGLALAEDSFTAEAKQLHERIISLDAHVDIPDDFATPNADPGEDGSMQVDLPKLERGGQSGAVFAVFVSQAARSAESYTLAIAKGRAKLAALTRMTTQYPEQIRIARSAAEVQRLHGEGKRIAVIGMLNGFPLGPRTELLDEYYAGGLRQFGFTHAGNNDLADSSRPQARLGDDGPQHGGLSHLGLALVDRLNAKGIIIDVSQLTKAGVEQVVAASRAPVIASHSALRARVDSPRNLTNQEMHLIAGAGGVIHIVAFGAYLRESPIDFGAELASIRARYKLGDGDVGSLPEPQRNAFAADVAALSGSVPKATLDQYVDAIEAAIKLVGIDHVGMSSDFGHGGGVVGWMNAGESYNVTAELLRRGYGEDAIAKLWGLNWLRVFEAVEATAENAP
ncbi:MAG: membrane dipeptidase [Gammaproteobacteria bacterium]